MQQEELWGSVQALTAEKHQLQEECRNLFAAVGLGEGTGQGAPKAGTNEETNMACKARSIIAELKAKPEALQGQLDARAAISQEYERKVRLGKCMLPPIPHPIKFGVSRGALVATPSTPPSPPRS